MLIVILSYFQNSYAQRTFFKDSNQEVSYECSCNQPKKHRGFEYSFWIADKPISINGIQAYPFYWGDSTSRSDTTGYLYLNESKELFFIDNIYNYIDNKIDSNELNGFCSSIFPIPSNSGVLNEFGDLCVPHLFLNFSDKIDIRYRYVYVIGEHIVSHFVKRIQSKDCLYRYKFIQSGIPYYYSCTWLRYTPPYITDLSVDYDKGIVQFKMENSQGLKFDCIKKK